MLFLLQTDCFDERTTFWMFQKIRKVFSTFQKISQKMATPERSGYSDFGQNWKSTKHAVFASNWLFWWKNNVSWMFQKNWKGIFNIWKTLPKKSTKKWPTPVRSGYSDFCQNWKVRQNMLFISSNWLFWGKNKILNVSEEFEELFSTFQKINQKHQPKKSTNKMATPVRAWYSDFGQNWKVRKTCCFCFKLIVLMTERNFECFRRIRRVFSTFEKLNQKNQPTKLPTR